MNHSPNSQKKTPVFGEIADVISIGALLRPTVVKAVAQLKADTLAELEQHLIDAERDLANSRLEFRERFRRAQNALNAAYAYAPVWRFIAARVEETWVNAATLTVKELSVVSLLFGILLEETQTALAKKTKKSA